MVITAMKSSPSQYQFPPPRDSIFAAHEVLPLQPLGLTARGVARVGNGQVYLRPMPVHLEASLSTLIADKLVYAARCCVEGNEWAIYLGISYCSILRSGFLTILF